MVMAEFKDDQAAIQAGRGARVERDSPCAQRGFHRVMEAVMEAGHLTR